LRYEQAVRRGVSDTSYSYAWSGRERHVVTIGGAIERDYSPEERSTSKTIVSIVLRVRREKRRGRNERRGWLLPIYSSAYFLAAVRTATLASFHRGSVQPDKKIEFPFLGEARQRCRSIFVTNQRGSRYRIDRRFGSFQMLAIVSVRYSSVLGAARKRKLAELDRFWDGVKNAIRESGLPIRVARQNISANTGGTRGRSRLFNVLTRFIQPGVNSLAVSGAIKFRAPKHATAVTNRDSTNRIRGFSDPRVFSYANRAEFLVERNYRPPLLPELSIFPDLAYRASKEKTKNPAIVATIASTKKGKSKPK